MLPDGWENSRLKQIAKIKSGSTPLRSKQDLYYSNDGTPWIKTLDLNNSDIFTTDERITDLALEETSCSIFPANTVLVAMYGGFNQIGRTGLITMPSAINQALSGLVLDQNKAYPRYVLNFLNGNVQQWKKFAASSRKDPNITREDVCSFEILLPPLPEQRKIAKILSIWDKAISTTERLIDNSKQQKKALMQQLLTGKKRLLDDSGRPFEGEWEEVKLKDISTFITKGATPTTYGYEWQNSGISFLRSECVGENGFKKSGLAYISEEAHETMSRSKVFSGDILITITGNVGRVCQLPESIAEANLNQHIAKVTISSDSVVSKFIYHVLSDSTYRRNFEKITTGQAYPQLSLEQVRNAIVSLPNKSEQQKIVSVLSNADKEIERLEKQLANLKQEKKALMQQLLTGKRRVKPDDTAAA